MSAKRSLPMSGIDKEFLIEPVPVIPAASGRARKLFLNGPVPFFVGANMKSRFALLLVAGSSLLPSCYPVPHVAPVMAVGESVANYAPGETITAAPGAVMLDRTDGS